VGSERMRLTLPSSNSSVPVRVRFMRRAGK
jgi:hypothetical protein